jgi:hypothetical protein
VTAREQSSSAKENADAKNSVESGQFLWLVGCFWSVCCTSYHCTSLGLKCLGHGADHLPPSSAKFKNEWSHTSASAVCFLGVYRDNCTLLPLPGSRQLTVCLQQDTEHLLSVINDPVINNLISGKCTDSSCCVMCSDHFRNPPSLLSNVQTISTTHPASYLMSRPFPQPTQPLI